MDPPGSPEDVWEEALKTLCIGRNSSTQRSGGMGWGKRGRFTCIQLGQLQDHKGEGFLRTATHIFLSSKIPIGVCQELQPRG